MDYTTYCNLMTQDDDRYDEVELVEPTTEIIELTINRALVEQMQHEKINYYTYLNFSGICNTKGLLGSAKFFREQSNEELDHSNWIFDFLCDRIGFVPELLEIPAQPFNPDMFLYDMVTEGLHIEIGTTNALCKIKKMAFEQDDFITLSFLDKIINEQQEEERLYGDIVNRFNMFGDTPIGIQKLDCELGIMNIYKC